MGRRLNSRNKNQSKISYPRECKHCGYISNNPSMYHYHMKTHEIIPVGKLCDHGCGNQALFKNTNNIYSCSKISQRCPSYIKTHSERVKKQWSAASDQRRNQTRQSLIERLHTPEARQQQKAAIRKKWKHLSEESLKEYRHYARLIRKRAQQWARNNGYDIGRMTYHVDHKYSIWEGFNAGIPEHIMNNPVNLEILPARTNSSKGARCSLTLEELYAAIENEKNQFNS